MFPGTMGHLKKIVIHQNNFSHREKVTSSVSQKQHPGTQSLFSKKNCFNILQPPLENNFGVPGRCFLGNCQQSSTFSHTNSIFYNFIIFFPYKLNNLSGQGPNDWAGLESRVPQAFSDFCNVQCKCTDLLAWILMDLLLFMGEVVADKIDLFTFYIFFI